MITAKGPTDWRNLQAEVARILNEAGIGAAVERKLQTARGAVAIDVYAEEVVQGRRSVLLFECKHWQSKVPQQVIHGFRTVVAETGANVGYIVSSAGFQSGAFEAAELTNIRLVTWEEFQRGFEQQWIEAHLLPTVADRLEKLLRYTEPLVPRSFMEVDDAGVERLKALRAQHFAFGTLVMRFTPYLHVFSPESRRVPSLPLRTYLAVDGHEGLGGTVPDAVLDAEGYREFLDAALEHGERVINEFRAALRLGGASDF